MTDGLLMYIPAVSGHYFTKDGFVVSSSQAAPFTRIKAIVLPPDGRHWNYYGEPLVLLGPDGPHIGGWPTSRPVLAILNDDHSLRMMVTTDPAKQLAVRAFLESQ